MTSGLPTRTLGRTGLEVTTLGYGAMALNVRSGPAIATDEARRILKAVLDAGINLIDTSPDYGPSEELIGASIAGRRDEFVLASKHTTIVGTANLDHLRANVEAARKGPLPADVHEEAVRRLDEVAAA